MSSLKGKRKVPNIIRGGRAIPFGNPTDNLYYLQGRSHAKGGIDIGENPRTGIEAEDGEVVQIKPNELRVLSAQDFIGGGISPAKQVLAGANPDQVFNEQERFKDRHRINDDGSKYKDGGIIRPDPLTPEGKKYYAKISGAANPINPEFDLATSFISVPKLITLGAKGSVLGFRNGRIIDVLENASDKVDKFNNYINNSIIKGIKPIVNYIDKKVPDKYRKQYRNITKKIVETGLSNDYAKPIINGTISTVRDNINEEYNQKRNGGMITTINGNIKNGLIVTPRYKCGGKRKKAEGGLTIRDINPATRGGMPVSAIPLNIELEGITPNTYMVAKRDTTKPSFINTSKSDYRILDRFLYNSIGGGPVSTEAENYRLNEFGIEPIIDNIDLTNENIRKDESFYNRQFSEGEYERLVKSGAITPQDIVSATRSGKRFGRDYNADREYYLRTGNFSVYTKNEEVNESKQTTDKSKQTSNNTQTANTTTESKNQTPRRRNTISTPISNNYSITNYEIQPDGSLKANGTRTGAGFKQYSKRSNQRTITDARVSRPWRETIGDDADILNTIAFGDNFENKKVQDAHSRLRQETGYDPNSGRAVIHEGVSEYSRKFNDRFNLANRKLGQYTTPAGRSGDNSTGERRKKYGGRRRADNGTSENRDRPYEDNAYGAQFDNRHYGRVEDRAYVQAKVDELRGPNMVRRAVFDRSDGYLGAIDALATPEIKGVNVTAPKIDLSPISKTVVPQAQARVAQKDALNRAPLQKNWRDEIGLGLGLAGSIIDPILRGRQLRNLRSWTPYTESPVKLKTNYNINPQLDRIRESSQEAYRDIDANTASSSTALARKQRVRNQAQYAANEQWGLKENKETQLINQDKLNLQGVRNRNTTRLNQWAADDARIANQITMAKAYNVSNAIQNVVGVGLDYLGRKDFKDYVNNTKAAIAAGAPNVDDRMLIANGLNLGDLYNAGIPTLATNTYRRGKFGSRIKTKRK